MPFNSAGVYTPPAGATTAAPGDVIKSATWNSIHTDISNALTLLGEQLYGFTSVTSATYTPIATDTFILINFNGAVTINLPSAASRNGYPLAIKDASGASIGANIITINRNGTDNIEGLASIKISSEYGGYNLFPVAVNNTWYIHP